VSTPAVSDIGYNSVECSLGGIVSDNTYNVITKGVCWSTSINPTVDDEKIELGPGFGGLACNIKDLSPGTGYYIRGYATNSLGTAYGDNRVIRTFDGYMTDYEGYEYNTVRLGNQEWMAKNLRTKHFMNGDLIETTYPLTLNIEQEDKPLYQWLLSGNEDFSKNYDRKYTWYTATDSRRICPTGWHLPSISEWNELLVHLGGEELTAELFRRSYNWGWGDLRNTRPYEGSFGANTSGYREVTGQYRNSNYGTYYWSETESSSRNVFAIYAGYNDFEIVMQTERDKKYGFSIRCIKD
jgi:uncharacterized protein (TIGR02145 family)